MYIENIMQILCVVLICFTFTFCDGFFVPKTGKHQYPGKEAVLKQKVIFELFQNILQNNTYDSHNAVGWVYNPLEDLDSYREPKVVKEFMDLCKRGIVQKNEVFNLNNKKHLDEAEGLFKVFYYANDWNTLYKAMCWARNFVSDRVFVYAFSVTLVHRDDLKGNELPPIFEIYPHYFINSDAIHSLQRYQMEGTVGNINISVNYSGWYINSGKDQLTSYFTEDVGLNQFFYYFNLDYPIWMAGDKYALHKDRRGELYLFTIRQLLARYELERLSNGLNFLPELSDEFTTCIPYHSSLRHQNGLEFPHRFVGYTYNNLSTMYEYVTFAKEYEEQIRKAIEAGFVVVEDGTKIDLRNPNGINALGDLLQGNADSQNIKYFNKYIKILKHLLVNTFNTVGNLQYPSELDYTFTELRDPATYQIFKKICNLVDLFYSYIPSYSSNDLYFPGVKIENVVIDKIHTYFDKYRYDITNAVYMAYDDIKSKSHRYTAFQNRLKHIPFVYNLTVTSKKAMDAVVRVFIGPNFDDVEKLEKYRYKFFQVDVYKYKLNEGENIISRLSSDYSTVVKDSMSTADLYLETIEAAKDNFTWNFDNIEAHCGFPERLLLPKGNENGLTYKFLFFISEFNPPAVPQFEGFNANYSCGVGSGARYVDDLPLAFPLDRKIDTDALSVPNLHFEDVIITFDRKLSL